MADYLGSQFSRFGVASSDASVYRSSAEDLEFVCTSCLKKGSYVEAKGYCVDCSEYLCRPCIGKHLTDNTMKGHVLLHFNRIMNVSDIDNGASGDSQVLRSVEVSSDSIDSSFDMNDMLYVKDVNVRKSDDVPTCNITGIVVLSDKKVAVCDDMNSNVKIIDVDNDVIQDSLKVNHKPIHMTLLPNDQLAMVSSGSYKIAILTTKPELKVSKAIRTEELPQCIVYTNGKLLVSFSNPLKFQLLDLNGAVLGEVNPDLAFRKLCSCPNFLAISPDEKTIFVSDWKSNVVVSLDRTGKKLAHSQDFVMPGGIILLDQLSCLLVCNSKKHTVQRLSVDLTKRVTVLNKDDGIQYPIVISMCPQRKHVIISSLSGEPKYSDYLKIFQM